MLTIARCGAATNDLSAVDEPRFHPWIWVVYVILFAAAIPWYLPPGAKATTWLGFPVWVTISLGATFSIALFTVFVIRGYWGDDTEDRENGT